MNHVQQHLDEIKKSISNSFAGERLTIEDLEKSASDYFEKAKAVTPLGTIKEFGGRPYIKTNDGWKYHGKGTGAKAQEHAKSAGVVSKYTKDDHTRLNELLNKRQAGILKHGSKEWNEYKALQAKYAEHLGAKEDKAKEKAADKVNVSQAIDDTFKQFEKQNSGPYLLNKVDKKVEKILKDSGLTVSKETLQAVVQGVLNKVHGKYETRPNMTHTIHRDPSFFEKQQLQQYAMHAGDEARHSLAKREMLAAEANKKLNAIRAELEEDGYDVDKLGNKLYMNNYDYSKVGDLSDYKKKTSKKESPVDLKSAVLKKFGLNESNIATQHSHEVDGGGGVFKITDQEIYASFSVGQTTDWDKGGSYTKYLITMSSTPYKGKYSAAVSISRYKNNYTNDLISEKYPIDYEEFDSKEKAYNKLANYLGLKTKDA